MADKKPTFGERVGGGGVGGALAGYLLGRGRGALIGGLGGAASHAAGYGISDDPVEGGAISNALMGGGAAFLGAGSTPGGASLVKHLMTRGLSKKQAIAVALGAPATAGALVGGGLGALSGGIESLVNDYEE